MHDDLMEAWRLFLETYRACCRPQTGTLGLRFGAAHLKGAHMIDIEMSNVEQTPVSLNPKDKYGNPTQIDDMPTWVVVSGDVTVEPSANGLSAMIISGATGDSVVVVTADADLGDGLVAITDRINVRVTDPMATNLGLTAGMPEPKPTV